MKHTRILWVTAAVFILDQVTKLYILKTMSLYQTYPVLGDFFQITYVENTGMAFGIQPAHSGLLTVVAVIVSLFIMYYLFQMKKEKLPARLALTAILGGAIGNLFDRIRRGSVVDFLDSDFFNIHVPPFKLWFLEFDGYSMTRWPVFNVADIAITLGMVLLFIVVFTEKEDEETPAQT
ncbi:MAG: signal peptidase II [candidate division KSB1 bacterium]|nr:signal peptidase II [candidate division KSB1 bacterium]